MRTGTATGPRGFIHDTAFFGTDAELQALVVPFLQDGIDAGEPATVSLGRDQAVAIRDALTDPSLVTFVPDGEHYGRPASAIRSYREAVFRALDAGADRVRAVGSIPRPGVDNPWDGWARYESAINEIFADLPLWGLCLYDTRTTPPHVVADVMRTHPHVAMIDGTRVDNERYVDPRRFLGRLDDVRRFNDPVTAGPPDLVLFDPTPAHSRRAVEALATSTAVRADAIANLLLGVSEVVSNAIAHGRKPIVLRGWAQPSRLVVTVADSGTGPAHPFVGLVPTPSTSGVGGLGLWISHQLCDQVDLMYAGNGFTVRLVAGALLAPG